MDIVKYFVEERKISEEVKETCVATAAKYGQIDCLKYLIEEAKVPVNDWEDIAYQWVSSNKNVKNCSVSFRE